jgi:hypothetical protein
MVPEAARLTALRGRFFTRHRLARKDRVALGGIPVGDRAEGHAVANGLICRGSQPLVTELLMAAKGSILG